MVDETKFWKDAVRVMRASMKHSGNWGWECDRMVGGQSVAFCGPQARIDELATLSGVRQHGIGRNEEYGKRVDKMLAGLAFSPLKSLFDTKVTVLANSQGGIALGPRASGDGTRTLRMLFHLGRDQAVFVDDRFAPLDDLADLYGACGEGENEILFVPKKADYKATATWGLVMPFNWAGEPSEPFDALAQAIYKKALHETVDEGP